MSDYVQVPELNPDEQVYKTLSEPLDENKCRIHQFTVYKIRWFMLYLQIMCATCMSMQFLEFSIISNIIVEFYGVSYEAVNWSTMLFLLIYIPAAFPTMYIINKISMKTALLITMVGSCAAAWIKIGSVASDRYWVILLGQVIVCLTQNFVMIIPTHFAAAWFGKNQVALACALGAFGIQLGSALGCVIPALVVKPSTKLDSVAYDLFILNIGFAVTSTLFLVLIFLCFKSKPPTPPSHAQKQLEEMRKLELLEASKQLFTNCDYILLVSASGIGIGIVYTIPTLLNQILAEYYSNSSEDAGRIGLIITLTGMLGVVVLGYILDKFGRYKLTTTLVFVCYLIGMVAFTLALHHSITAVYIASSILGFFLNATYSVCLEVSAELTYPIPEATSSGYLLAIAQAVGIGFIYLYSFFLYEFGATWANIVVCLELGIAVVLTACMKFKLKRRAAEKIVIGN